MPNEACPIPTKQVEILIEVEQTNSVMDLINSIYKTLESAGIKVSGVVLHHHPHERKAA